MKFAKTGILFLLLLGIALQSQAQSLDLFSFQKPDINYSEFTAILHEGVPLVRDDSPDGPLQLGPRTNGKLSVYTIDRSGETAMPVSPIGFKVAIKNYKTNSIWMYSTAILYELDLEEILKECSWGDTLIFMTVDRKYRLPRHEVTVIDGC